MNKTILVIILLQILSLTALAETYTDVGFSQTFDSVIVTDHDGQNKVQKYYTYYSNGSVESFIECSINSRFGWVKNAYFYDEQGRELANEYYIWDYDNEEFYGYSKQSNEFNSNGKIIEEAEYYWKDKNWSYTNKTVYEFDAQNRELLKDYYEVNADSTACIVVSKVRRFYSANDDSVSYESKSYNTYTNQWRIGPKSDTIYDVNGNQTKITIYGANDTEDDWIIGSKREMKYDEDSHRIEMRYYNYLSGIFVNDTKHIYEYDDNGNNVSDIFYKWDSKSVTWVEHSSKVRTFNTKGEITSLIMNEWDTNELMVVPYQKMIYTYNDNGLFTSDTQYTWNSSGYWQTSHKYELNYDENGNKTLIAEYMNDGGTGWLPIFKNIYTYDTYGNRTLEDKAYFDSVTLLWYGNSKKEAVYDDSLKTKDIYYTWDTNLSDWIVSSITTYTRNEKDNSFETISEILDEGVLVYNYKTVATFVKNSKAYTETYSTWVNGAWVQQNGSRNEHDSEDNLIKNFDQYFDNDSNAIVERLAYNYTYYINGKVYVPQATSTVGDIQPMTSPNNSLIVAPTPTKDAAKVIALSDESGVAVFTIYTKSVRKIAVMKRDMEEEVYDTFDFKVIAELPKGIYFVEMKVNSEVKAISKIIKINK